MAKCINFSLELMRFLYRETTNIVLSPLSLEIAALSILSGVKNASFDEMRDSIFDMKISLRNINDFSSALKSIISEIKSLQDMEFKMYNFIYISSKYKLNEQYMNNVTKNLDTSLKLVNFEDTSLELYNMIDAEVSDATMGRINKVIQNVPTVSNMLLINSTTLQVNESRQSISSATSSKQLKQLFKSSYEGRTSIATTTEYDKAMDISFSVHNGQFKYYHDNEQGYTCVELSYINANLNLILILPKEGSSPRDIINQLSQNKLQSISKLMALKQLEIKIPIIKLKMNIDLAYVWQIIGIQKIFDQDEADFSGLSTNPKGLCLESIIFNSEISLNGNFKEKTVSQESSKSKSSSSSTNKKTGGKKSTTVLSVAFNRPFIYFVTCNIKEQRKVILFAGVVNNLLETN
ncbi:Serpin peptidase inhibitor, clade B (ovalbumin), member 11 (protein pseudoprotein) [Dermatophagoides pteronyssinus]|uniref:Serpin B11-like isoform X1 n=2 Tax=Dermatophagoides pteronyssinus TaxID=6956 RepID=A0A6P6XNP0_DERPT|nr:serpin B11-like isoform X1 [Dermatophagoides pteronyssinus]KAH9419445.1 Serpin peptidase inhibitor, clade B (ovalbumin), member 11 (protein pseudoprotein) [Dermatophagoides pteronyssinus]